MVLQDELFGINNIEIIVVYCITVCIVFDYINNMLSD